MSIIYQLTRTDGSGAVITINPGEANSLITDLELYGQGALNWGRGVDQNQLSLLENFACPGIIDNGRLRPVNRNDSGVPDYNEDNVSTGINNPIRGQLWYNTADRKMYQCADPLIPLWETTGADADLFLPLAGGVITGDLDLLGADPRITITTNTNNTTPRVEFNDSDGVKAAIIMENGTPTDNIIIRKATGGAGQNAIQELLIKDDGFEFNRGPAGSALGAGTIRISESITTAHAGNTLVTKDYVAAQNASFLPTTGGVITGALSMESANPVFTIQSTNQTDDAEIVFKDSISSSIRGTIALDQGPTGFGANIDHMFIQKQNGSFVFSRIEFRDSTLLFTGDDVNDGAAVVSTAGATQGKIQTPATVASDNDNTLTTKRFVEDFVDANTTTGNFVALGGQATGMTGLYRFGSSTNFTDITAGNIVVEAPAGGRLALRNSDITNNGVSTILFEDTTGPTTTTRATILFDSTQTFSDDQLIITRTSTINSRPNTNIIVRQDNTTVNKPIELSYSPNDVALFVDGPSPGAHAKRSYSQPNTPTQAHQGDLWYNTSNGTMYINVPTFGWAPIELDTANSIPI